MEEESGTEDEAEEPKTIGVLIAKARKNYRKDCMSHSRNKIRLVRKQKKGGRRLPRHPEHYLEPSTRGAIAHSTSSVQITRGQRYTRPTRRGSLTL